MKKDKKIGENLHYIWEIEAQSMQKALFFSHAIISLIYTHKQCKRNSFIFHQWEILMQVYFNTSKYTIKENTVSVECFRLDTVYWVLVSKALTCLSELTQC